MIDWKRWLPGLPDDEDEDPVSKTLRSLQQGVSDVGAGISQGVQNLGTGLSTAAQTASSYLPDLNPTPSWTPEEQETEAEIERRRGIVRAGAAAAPAAAFQAGREAYEDPLTSTMPAPARAVAIASRAGSAAGQEFGAGIGEATAGGNEPFAATPEAPTPFGTVPSMPITPRAVGGAVGSVLGDPTSYVLPGGAADAAADLAVRNLAGPVARAAGRGLRAAGREVGTLAGEATEGLGAALGRNAENVAAADARMAAEGGTALPGTLGVITDNPLEAGRAARTRIVPPEVADTLDFPLRVPDDPALIRAVEAAGGTVDERGVTLNVIRHQDPEAAGGVATRSMPFYTAGKPGTPSPYATSGTVGPQGVGGQQRIEGPTRFRNPLIIKDAPGEPAGFDDAMRQTRGSEHPRLAEARQAAEQAEAADQAAYHQRYDAMEKWYDDHPGWTEEQAEAFRASPAYASLTDELFRTSTAGQKARAALHAAEQAYPTASADVVEQGIRAAKRAGPAGSPERAEALRGLVSRYGGDVDVIDDLIGLRGADMGESVYAVKENIVAHNARRAGHDGVITIMRQEPGWQALSEHPAYHEAGLAANQADRALAEATQAHQRSPSREHWQAYQRAVDAASKAQDDFEAARETAMRELSAGKITELADPREARNPTPGPLNPRVEQARQAFAEAFAEEKRLQADFNRWRRDWYDNAPQADRAQFYKNPEVQRITDELAEAQQRADGLRQAYQEVRDASPLHVGPTGYTLREDIPRRAAPTRDALVAEWDRLSERYRQILDERDAAAPGTAARAAAEARARALKPALDDLNAQLKQADSATATATAGALPATRDAGALSAVNRALSEGIAGGVGGAVLEQGRNPDEDPRTAAARGFAVGAVGFPAATRLARGAARLAGAADTGAGGALATFGTPGAGGAPQPGPGFFAQFPGAQKAIAASQARAANMAARGITAPSAADWIKQFGYSGIFGPATATGQLISGAVDVGLAQPKEAIRALTTGKGGRYSAQARAQLQAVPEAWQGVLRIVGGQGGPAGAAARSGGAQGTANLSERVVNPVAHFAARALEYPGEVLAEAPDAVFRPLFNAQGMQREADTIATELGHKGQQAKATADRLMQEARAARANPGQQAVSAEAQRIVDAGKAYADEMGYKGDPGGIADWIGQQAKRDDAIGLAASFLFPFSRTPGNIALATARSTPGLGLLPSVRQGRPLTSFDTVYDQAFGTLAASGFAYYATQGGITGSGPTDKAERDAMIAKGWQPRSFLVPGGYYVPNRALGKWGAILDAIGEAHDVMAYAKPGGTGADYMTDAVKRISRIATDQVGLSGLADLADLADGVGSQLPGTIGRSVTRYVPFGGIIRSAALAADPTGRKPEGWSAIEKAQTPPEQRGFWSGLTALRGAVGEQVAQNIPGLRGGVPEAQDVLGRPMPNAQAGAGVLVPKTTSVREDPTVQAFQQAGVDISAPKTELTVDGIPVELTPEESRRWNTARGEVLIRVAPGMTGRDFWSKPAARQQAMQDVLRDANAAADAKILASLGASEVQRRVREAGRRQREALTQKAS